MSGKGDRNRSGQLPDDCVLWKDKKPAYLKTEAELEESSGTYVLRNGKLVKGSMRQADTRLMESVTFGRTKPEQARQLKILHKAGIEEAVGYSPAGGLLFTGGLKTQKKLCRHYGKGVLEIG